MNGSKIWDYSRGLYSCEFKDTFIDNVPTYFPCAVKISFVLNVYYGYSSNRLIWKGKEQTPKTSADVTSESN